MTRVLALAAALAVALAPLAPPRDEDLPPRLASAAEQLEHAHGARVVLRGMRGAERVAARAAAVRAYRAVLAHWPHERVVCAEAAFRAGELLRADGAGDEALVLFRRARAEGAGTEFRARSAIEIGHLHRRAERWELALDAYCAVAADLDAAPRHRDDAALWAGRAWSELGREREAERAWERVARTALDPLDRVRAYDCLALALVGRGRLEGAAAMLQRCREDLADVASEETEAGERVRKALELMRALDRLRDAIEERRRKCDATSDELDSGRRKPLSK